jgi:hypothetical protein
VASVLLLLPEVNMLVAGLLVVVLHRHRWNHLADLQKKRSKIRIYSKPYFG